MIVDMVKKYKVRRVRTYAYQMSRELYAPIHSSDLVVISLHAFSPIYAHVSPAHSICAVVICVLQVVAVIPCNDTYFRTVCYMVNVY